MYSMNENVYECDLCGFREPALDTVDLLHGAMWTCEDCGIDFCERCFTNKWGRAGWEDMLQTFSGVLCPDCYGAMLINPETGEPYNDETIEQLWEIFTDIPMNPATECMEAPFLHFDAATPREEIWHWFDRRHSKGIVYLLYGYEKKES